jgi:hypothetical protein
VGASVSGDQRKMGLQNRFPHSVQPHVKSLKTRLYQSAVRDAYQNLLIDNPCKSQAKGN